MEERTGKTLTAILTAEMTKVGNILVITKKRAIEGWEETLELYPVTKNYTVINYEAIHKLSGSFDLVIIDESHANLAAFPKMGKRAKDVQKITFNLPIIFLSATPSAQSYAQLFHQFAMTKYSPFYNYANFYKWFKDFGVPTTKYIHGRALPQYDVVKTDEIWKVVSDLFISYTRAELGFKHEPLDRLHFIELKEGTQKIYNELKKTDVIEQYGYVADTPMKKLLGLHQIEGSTLKTDEIGQIIPDIEKVEYIQKTWGDTEDLVIFYQYKLEETLLKMYFKKAKILQGTAFAEGVDLHKYKTVVVYSMDFSTARYSQRRARQCNMKRDEEITVHYLLVKNSISHQVYNTVAINKKNFVDRYFA